MAAAARIGDAAATSITLRTDTYHWDMLEFYRLSRDAYRKLGCRSIPTSKAKLVMNSPFQ